MGEVSGTVARYIGLELAAGKIIPELLMSSNLFDTAFVTAIVSAISLNCFSFGEKYIAVIAGNCG